MTKISRNSPCPCGSGKKYKKCCAKQVDWQRIIDQNDAEAHARHLSTRGKNLLFLNALSSSLQLNKLPTDHQWDDVKRGVTPEAVREIHSAIAQLWPSGDDLKRILKNEASASTGLYLGGYHPDSISRGITRHSLYTDRLLVIDPFAHPAAIAPQYNPLENPSIHRSSSLTALRVWWLLAPWIEADIVHVIRRPGDFDTRLEFDCMEASKKRSEQYPELKQVAEEDFEDNDADWPDLKEYAILIEPDWHLTERFQKSHPDATEAEINQFLRMIAKRRASHPFYLEDGFTSKGGEGQLLAFSTGANLEMAQIISEITGSHLITDIKYRWKEIEIVRKEHNLGNGVWSEFAKAFSEVELKYINDVSLAGAIRVRKENRLDGLRSFMRQIWKKVRSEDPFSEELVHDLAAELRERVAAAESEWRQIDIDLVKWSGVKAAAGLAAIPTLSSASPEWLAASVLTAGAASLGVAALKRRSFHRREPASFFLGPK